MKNDFENCPYCGGKIKAGAIKCKHCYSMLGEVQNNGAPDPVKETFKQKESLETLKSAHWSGAATKTDGKGFLASLFDVSMTEMVTPKIIRFIYLVGLVVIAIGAFGVIISAVFMIGNTGFVAMFGTLIMAAIGAFIAVIFLRIYLEIIILLFNIYEKLVEINMSRGG